MPESERGNTPTVESLAAYVRQALNDDPVSVKAVARLLLQKPLRVGRISHERLVKSRQELAWLSYQTKLRAVSSFAQAQDLVDEVLEKGSPFSRTLRARLGEFIQTRRIPQEASDMEREELGLMLARVAPLPTSVQSRSILIIDDDSAVGRAVGHAISRHMTTYKVTVVTEANVALSLVEGGARYDAIVCDLRMPLMDGEAFYEALAAKFPEMIATVVFMSGDRHTHQEFLGRIPNICLQKPFDRDALRAALDLAISSRAS